MKKICVLVLLVATYFAPLWGQAGFSSIDSLIQKILPEGSEVGISVYDLTAGKPLYGYRDAKLSRPASMLKLLTAITALSCAQADGIEEIEKLIRMLGRRPDDYKLADGSGLSNYNYVSPALIVDFLTYAYSQTSIFQKLYKSEFRIRNVLFSHYLFFSKFKYRQLTPFIYL